MAKRKYFVCNVTVPIALKSRHIRQNVTVCAQNILTYASDHVLVNEARLLDAAVKALPVEAKRVCSSDLRSLAQHRAIPRATEQLKLAQQIHLLACVREAGRSFTTLEDIYNTDDADVLFYLENKQQANAVLKAMDESGLSWWHEWCTATAESCRTQRTRLAAWLVRFKAEEEKHAKKAAEVEAARHAAKVTLARILLEGEGYTVQAPKKVVDAARQVSSSATLSLRF